MDISKMIEELRSERDGIDEANRGAGSDGIRAR
jgi:hypothetical protein